MGKSGICGGGGIELTHGGCGPTDKNPGAGGSGFVGSGIAKSFSTRVPQFVQKVASTLNSLPQFLQIILMTIPFENLLAQNNYEKELSFCASIAVPVRGAIGTLLSLV